MRHKVYFINQQKEWMAEEGQTLAQVCAQAGFPLNLVCGGKGTCGKCKIIVEREGKKKQVLACQTLVTREERIYLETEDYTHTGNVLTEGNGKKMMCHPSVKKRYRRKEELMPERYGAFFKKMKLEVMRKFSTFCTEYDFEGCTFVYFKDEVIDVQKGDTTKECYGMAVDIGTTTVACYFYDLIQGRLLAVKSGLNQQVMHGADVIARISFAGEKTENLKKLQDLVRETINTQLDEAEKEIKGIKENLYHIVLCGNSTMQHFFYGFSPQLLGRSPFVTITKELVRTTIQETGLHGASEGVAEFLPLLGGFVGADTVAVLLTVPEDQKYIVVDLGTNGEIVVGDQQGYVYASTACGPALEGGNIACGMRGTTGAIEKVSLENDGVRLQVIGEGQPRGLCGSGILDTVAMLRKAGWINETGNLLSAKEYEEHYSKSPLEECVHEVEPYNRGFYLDEKEPSVYLSQKDIRQIQLAKSAIFSGCMTLLKEKGMTLEDVDVLLLAGAFGNYIDVDHALFLGLLPPVRREKIVPIGNGAGQGVQAFLLDQRYREKLKNICQKGSPVELAENAAFMELYLSHMNF